jgi:hypothetical protein
MGNLHLRRVELSDCLNLCKCNDNLPFTKGRQHGPNPAGGGLIGKIPWNLLEKRIEASFGGNSSHLNLTAPPSVPIAIAQTAGSLREIRYLCVFAPLRLCVLFFQTAGSLREIHYGKGSLGGGGMSEEEGTSAECWLLAAR